MVVEAGNGTSPVVAPVMVADDDINLDGNQTKTNVSGANGDGTGTNNDGTTKDGANDDASKVAASSPSGNTSGNDNPDGNNPPLTDKTVIDTIAELTGYMPTDETGKPLVYETPDDYNGVAKYVVDTAKQLGQKFFVEEQQKFEQAFPLVKQVSDLVINYGINDATKLAQFLTRPDYSQIQVTKDTPEQNLIDIVTQAETRRGRDAEATKELIDFYKAGGKLAANAERDLKYLSDADAAEKTAEAARVTAERNAEQEITTKYWNDVKQIITSRKVGDITLPEVIKVGNETKGWNDFWNYLTTPTKDGYTQAQIDEINMPIEQEVLLAFSRFTKGNMASLIKAEAATQNVNNLKGKLGSGKLNSDAAIADKNKGKGRDEDIDFDNLDTHTKK